MKEREIKAKTLVESLEIGADLLKSAGKGLCAAGHTVARGIHTTIHEIINGIGNVVNTATKNKKNSLMTACIFGGVVLACIINANMVEKNNAVIMAKYSVIE